MTDFVEKVRNRTKSSRRLIAWSKVYPISGRLQVGHRDQLGEFPKVLGGCCEDELIAGAIRSSQSESVELEYALEVREQHLDLLAQSSRCSTFPRLCDLARHITSVFVD